MFVKNIVCNKQKKISYSLTTDVVMGQIFNMVLIYFLPCVMNRFNLMVGSRKGSSVGRKMENNTKVFGSEISFFCHSDAALLGFLSQMFRKK